MRLNLRSSGRALLMLFLFSDVDDDDAPTRIEVGSHLEVPRLLAPAGEAGLTYLELAERFDPESRLPDRARDRCAGDVYLCHPVPGARGAAASRATPKFMAQPPLQPRTDRARSRRRRLFAGRTAIRIGLGLQER